MALDEKRYKDLLTRAYNRIQELEASQQNQSKLGDEVAIIGTAFRFPGHVTDEASLWKMLTLEHHVIGNLPEARWDPAYNTLTDYKAGYLNNIYDFDSRFFGFASEEVAHTDPQQRLMLEISAEAFHHAGINLKKLSDSKTGVFIGAAKNSYNDVPVDEITEYLATGGSVASIAGRISYFFNLHGPSVSLDTTCSSSLTAIIQAIHSLNNNDCNLAIAGGINLIVSPEGHLGFVKLGVLSDDFTCRAFDKEANGIVRAEGCGMVVLKKLKDALVEGDRILGIIKGAAINHDGTSNGFAAPNQKAQTDVISTALKKSAVAASDVSYVEAHGTGTLLGDIIELNALKNTYGEAHGDHNPLTIGSIKSNIGHAEFAAGMAGLVKILACFKNEAIPPQVNFNSPSPRFEWENSGLSVAQRKPWPRNETKRIAAISSFGITGTNVHLIIEEPPVMNASTGFAPEWQIVAMSAKSKEALGLFLQSVHSLIEKASSAEEVYQITHQLHLINSQFPNRHLIVARDHTELKERIDRALKKEFSTVNQHIAVPKAVFVFPGQGTQYQGMAKTMIQKFSVFREAFTECRELILKESGEDIFETLEKTDDQTFVKTSIHFTLFAYQYALAKLWMSFGFFPNAVMGLSMGELAASCISGVLSLKESIRILTIRTEVLVEAESGQTAMAVVEATQDELEKLLSEYNHEIEIAVYGSPRSFVLSGPTQLISQFVAQLESKNRMARKISTSVATHCRLIESYMPRMVGRIGEVQPSNPVCPMFSTADADWLTTTPDAGYWHRNTRQPVRFAQATETLINHGYNIFIEINPHPSTSFNLSEISKHLKQKSIHIASSFRKEDEYETFLMQLDQLYKTGAEPRWQQLFPQPAPMVEIPLPAWNRSTFKKIYAFRSFQKPEENLIHLPERISLEKITNLTPIPVFLVGENPETLSSENVVHVKSINEIQSEWKDRIRIVTSIDQTNTLERLLEFHKKLEDLTVRFLNIDWILLFNQEPSNNYKEVENAWLAKLAEIMGSEEEGINVKIIAFSKDHLNPSLLIDEIKAPIDRFTYISLEKDRRTALMLQPHILKTIEFKPDNDGIYLVTGGTGGVGLQTALFLAGKGAENIALVSRNNRFGAENRDKNRNNPNYQSVLELESKAKRVEHLQSDVTDSNLLASTIAYLREKYTRIAGVFHCAGGFGEGILREQTPDEIGKIAEAKIIGTILLHELTLLDQPKHFVLYSSISSLFNTQTLGAYSASNSYVNAFAHWRREQKLPATAIVWPLWKESGIAADRGEVHDTAFKAITNNEVFQVLNHCLVCSDPVLIAGKINHSPDFAPVFDSAPFLIPGLKKAKKTSEVISPIMTGVAAADTKGIIKTVWSDFLGHDQIDDDQNFFHLGGNSILATRITNRLKEVFKGLELTVADVLRSLTISKLTGLIDSRLQEKSPTQNVSIKPLPKQIRYPVSNEQKRFWLQSKVHENASFNNLTGSYRLTGPINIALLEKAFTLIIDENEILRTTYEELDGEVYQVIHNKVVFVLNKQSGKTIEETNALLESAFYEEANFVYDLAADFPLRGSVFPVEGNPETELSVAESASHRCRRLGHGTVYPKT
jgi:acyl transferase domain-containing protein/NADP-dependent 3-hydroxy acid dehydrogenase YdfG